MRTKSIFILLIILTFPTFALAQEFRVQLGVYRQEAAAVDGWQALKSRFPGLLAGRMPQLEPVRHAGGVMLRLSLYVEDASAAHTLEQALRGQTASAQAPPVKRRPVKVQQASQPGLAPASPEQSAGSSASSSANQPGGTGVSGGTGGSGITGRSANKVSSVGARPSLNTSMSLKAGAVPGSSKRGATEGARGYVGLAGHAGRVTITPGVAASKDGGVGPYAGLQITF